jgi:two-component system chemotaxis response regulator CheB
MTAPPRIRVLVVDDSAFARKVIREILQACPDIEVVDIARDGLDAIEKIAALKPDVITLDLVMPELDGVGVLRELARLVSPPRAVVVSMADERSEVGVEALQCGAFDIVHKSPAIATGRLYELGDELVQKVRAAAAASSSTIRQASEIPVRRAPLIVPARAKSTEVLVIGASTGGPQAVTRLLTALPKAFPVPIAVVLHMPAGYTAAFAERLDGDCALDVVEARHNFVVSPGCVVVARAGMHLKLGRSALGCQALLDVRPLEGSHRPSVDVLFTSASQGWGAAVLGVVLTGMGNDGLEGSRAIHATGGRVLTEAESSCVVYGMPRAVAEAKLAHATAPLDQMVHLILQNL